MKNLMLILFLYLSLFTAFNAYAETNTITVNYPANGGNYNTINVQTENSHITPNCITGANGGKLGVLYVDTATNSLMMCAQTVNGGVNTPVSIPDDEICFNRFCSCNATTCSGGCSIGGNGFSTYNPCTVMGNYVQGQYTNGTIKAINDSFPSGGAYTVYSTVCCQNNSTVTPTS